MFKRFMRSNAVQISLGLIVAAYMTFVKYTTRWDTECPDEVQQIIDRGGGLIALVWHARFMMLTAAWKKQYQQAYVLISLSREGNIVAHTSHFLGVKTIRGSTRKPARGQMTAKVKGGAKASLDIVTAIENKNCIVMTPDGPRGPSQRMSNGPIRLAKLTGVPLMPCTFAVRNRKVLNTWDRLVVPLPFGKGKVIWGTPIRIPEDTDEQMMEHIRQRIEIEMNTLQADADRAVGHAPVEPATQNEAQNKTQDTQA